MQALELWIKVCGTTCIEVHVRKNITVKGLCQMPDVSYWTLEHAFKKRLEIVMKAHIF